MNLIESYDSGPSVQSRDKWRYNLLKNAINSSKRRSLWRITATSIVASNEVKNPEGSADYPIHEQGRLIAHHNLRC